METFWSCYRGVAGLVLKPKLVMAATGGWSYVRQQVVDLTQSPSLGEKMFGFVAEALVSQQVSDLIGAQIKSLCSESITKARVHVVMDIVEVETKKLNADEVLTNRREVHLRYR